MSSPAVHDNECIGSVLVRLDDIVHSSRELMYQLLHEDASKAARVQGAIIILTYENEAEEGEEPPAHNAAMQTSAKSSSASSFKAAPPSATPARGTVTGRMSMSPAGMSSDEDDPTPPRRGGGGRTK